MVCGKKMIILSEVQRCEFCRSTSCPGCLTKVTLREFSLDKLISDNWIDLSRCGQVDLRYIRGEVFDESEGFTWMVRYYVDVEDGLFMSPDEINVIYRDSGPYTYIRISVVACYFYLDQTITHYVENHLIYNRDRALSDPAAEGLVIWIEGMRVSLHGISFFLPRTEFLDLMAWSKRFVSALAMQCVNPIPSPDRGQFNPLWLTDISGFE